MKKRILCSSLFVLGLIFPSFLSLKPQETAYFDDIEYTKPGLVAYSAVYDTSITNEPNYLNQYNYGIKNLNFGDVHTEYRGEGVKVAIIDSGINYSHEDFSEYGIQASSKYFTYDGSSWVHNTYSSSHSNLNDTLGHGTNVAASAAALVNGKGGFGIAPNVDLYIYKVTNSNNGYEFGAIQTALDECYKNHVDVINMSFQAYVNDVSYGTASQSGSGSTVKTIMTYWLNRCYNAGITLVAAAGNFNTTEKSYPASNGHVISVGALAEGSDDTKAGYSNLSDIDLVAPGTVYVADKGTSTSYKKTGGTSFAAPIVTGAIALYKQKYPTATPDEIEKALYDSCDKIEGEPSWSGHGRLNIEAFLNEETVDPTSISLSENSLNFDLADLEHLTAQLSATVLPVEADTKAVTWSSSKSSVATVSSSGLVTAKGYGEATITATTKKGGLVASCTVNVTNSNAPVTGITIENDALHLIVGQEPYQLEWEVEPSYAREKGVIFELTEDDGTLSIDESGLITPLKEGYEEITVISKDNNAITANVLVEVSEGLASVSMSGFDSSVPYKGTFSSENIVITAHYSDESFKTVTPTSTNYSVNTSVLGYQEISATYEEDNITRTCTQRVKVTNDGASSNVGVSTLGEEKTATGTFTTQSGAISVNKTTETITFTPNGGSGFDSGTSARGVQWSKKAASVSISGLNNTYLVKSISVVASANDNNSSLTMFVTVGGVAFGSSKSIPKSTTNQSYAFSGSATGGAISIAITAGSKSSWIKSVSITYQKAGNVYPASPTDQARAWSNYFLTSVKGFCNISGEGSDIAGIGEVWNEIASEYGYMTSESKNEFFTSEDETIVEARTLYKMIIQKYQSETITDFATDGSGNFFIVNNLESFNGNNYRIVLIISIIFGMSIIAIGLICLTKKKEK